GRVSTTPWSSPDAYDKVHAGTVTQVRGIALFGPGVVGALFMNSDFSEPGRQNNWQRCTKCQVLTFAGSPNLGACPVGGTHDHTGSRNYLVAFSSKGLAYAGDPAMFGLCPQATLTTPHPSGGSNLDLMVRAASEFAGKRIASR